MASNEIVGILHADMIVGPNYSKNILKHLKKGKVVCGTRVEPPLHPAGKEKIIKDFGLDFDTLDVDGFETFCIEEQVSNEDLTTKGMFAPCICILLYISLICIIVFQFYFIFLTSSCF
jgi:hypothetical protein